MSLVHVLFSDYVRKFKEKTAAVFVGPDLLFANYFNRQFSILLYKFQG